VPTVRAITLGELASRLGRAVEGDADFVVRGIASLDDAGPGDLVFVRGGRFAEAFAKSSAGAAITVPSVDTGGRPTIRSPRPDLDFARAVALLVERARPPAGIHPNAVVAPDARIDPSASIGPFVVVGARSEVGARSVVHPNVVLYPEVRIGADCELHAGVVIREECEIGNRVILHPGVAIGADGFGYAFDEAGRPAKIPQVGRVVIEDDVEIGALTAIDRATLGVTRIGQNTKIDDLCIIAHNCEIGPDVIIVGLSGLAGSTVVEKGAILMGQTATTGHLRVGARAFLGGRAAVHKDVPAGVHVWGAPAMEQRSWHKSMAALARLPEALRRLRAVERMVGLRSRRSEDDA
jgi:UDP-3-O-[3-hydroxymyristoyl] glucosamine N-acyltransferase